MTTREAPIRCPECGAENAAANRFCETCGLVLSAARKSSDSPPRRRARRPTVEHGERVAIQSDVTKARRTIGAIRGLYGVLAGFAAVATILVFSETARAEGAWPVFFVSLVLTLALAAGALFGHLHPLGWTLALACLWSIQAALAILAGGYPVLEGLLAVALWATVPMMLKVHRMMREHPDLVDKRKLARRERRAGVGLSEAQARALVRDREHARAGLRTFATIAGIVIALIGGVWAVIAMTGDPRPVRGHTTEAMTAEESQRIAGLLPARIREFEAAWARDDLPAIEAMFVPEKQVTFWPKVLRLLERRGWSEDLPTIGVPDYTGGGWTSKDVFFEIEPKGTLKTRWKWDVDAWSLDHLVFAYTR